MTDALQRDHVLTAIVRLAHQCGLPCDDFSVLSERGNMVVDIGSGIIARAVYLTAFTRKEPVKWLQREVDVAKAMFKIGAAVAPPAAHLPHGPYVIDGVPITLWEDATPDDYESNEFAVANMLFDFHKRGMEIRFELPWLTPLTEQIPETLDALGNVNALETQTLGTLWNMHQGVLDMIQASDASYPFLVHGDAHPGNIIQSWRGPVWIDLEEACNGPMEWDLACLWRSSRVDGEKAISEYRSMWDMDPEMINEETLSPFLLGRALEATVWLLGLAHQQPERYMETAQQHLIRLLSSAPGTYSGLHKSWCK